MKWLVALWVIQVGLPQAGEPGGVPGEPLFAFGVVADIQYADKPTAGRRCYRDALDRLRECVEEFNRRDLALVVNLGDLIDGNGDRTGAELARVMEVLRELKAPVRHVIGNHCLEYERTALQRALDLPAAYYAMTRGDWTLLVLDGMDVSAKSPPGSAGAAEAQAYLERESPPPSYNGGLGSRQLTWLERELAEADRERRRVLLLCHFPVLREASDEQHLLWNHREVMAILDQHPCVVAWLNGHDHRGGYAERDGVYHITFAGLVESAPSESSFATILVYPDRLVLEGRGQTPSRTLALATQSSRSD